MYTYFGITYKIFIGQQVVEATNYHPFWVVEKGWILAEDLQAVDKLQQADGNLIEITIR